VSAHKRLFLHIFNVENKKTVVKGVPIFYGQPEPTPLKRKKVIRLSFFIVGALWVPMLSIPCSQEAFSMQTVIKPPPVSPMLATQARLKFSKPSKSRTTQLCRNTTCNTHYSHKLIQEFLAMAPCHKTQLLLIPGLWHEITHRIYHKDIRQLKAHLATDLDIHVNICAFPSYKKITENIQSVHEKILALYEKHREPIFLVGHSKGGLEALYTILRFPELILKGIIKAVVCVQAPAQGSRWFEAHSKDCRLRWLGNAMGGALETFLPATAQQQMTEHLEQFQSRVHLALEKWNPSPDELMELQETVQLSKNSPATATESGIILSDLTQSLLSRVYFVRSFENPDNLSRSLQLLLRHFPHTTAGLEQDQQQHDGILFVDEQRLSIGNDLGLLQADHVRLIGSSTQPSKNPAKDPKKKQTQDMETLPSAYDPESKSLSEPFPTLDSLTFLKALIWTLEMKLSGPDPIKNTPLFQHILLQAQAENEPDKRDP
jgi:pimeloyl-ACP methyl ester carboxylesterase